MITRNRSRKTAFTLIELLVVVAIISLLVSILLPSLAKAKELAKKVVCMSNIKQVALGYIMYTSESDGLVPPGFYNGTEQEGRAFVDWVDWAGQANRVCANDLIYPYVDIVEIFFCPSEETWGSF